MTLIIDTDAVLTEENIRDTILNTPGYELRSAFLGGLGELQEKRQKLFSVIAKLSDLTELCTESNNKIIDIPCSGVADFDFMSV